jgi:6-pyruvoyl-tetrahydropterin synthase
MSSEHRLAKPHSYNIMNDDIDDDTEVQIEISDYPEEKSEIPINPTNSFMEGINQKLFFLQKTENSPMPLTKLQMPDYSYFSNSPSSISGNSSPKEGEYSFRKPTYRKLTFEEVENSLQKHFHQDKFFAEMDILITFIKGQKHIFSQSYIVTRQKVHLLIFPCLCVTSAIMVIAPIIQNYEWSGYLLSGLNAMLTLFISILNFWNLQHIMIQYNMCATHFDRLETSLVMSRNQIYLLENEKEKPKMILQKMRETENRMMELKDATSILIPTEVQSQAPIICHFDIFAFIHKVEQHQKTMIMNYKDIKNEIRYIMFKWKTASHNDSDIIEGIVDINLDEYPSKETYYRSFLKQSNNLQKEQERQRLNNLLKEKEIIKQKLLDNHHKYADIDQVFTREIRISEKNQNNFWFLVCYYICCYMPKVDYKSEDNTKASSVGDDSFRKYMSFP